MFASPSRRIAGGLTALLLATSMAVAGPRNDPAGQAAATETPYQIVTDTETHGLTIIEPTTPTPAVASEGVAVLPGLAPNGIVIPAGYECPTEGCCGAPCPACRQARFHGWSVFAEVISRDPAFAGGTLTLSDSDDHAAAGPRITFGYEGRNGGGVEFRFSGVAFDELGVFGLAPSPGDLPVPSEMRVFQFDTDFYQRLWIGDTSLVVSAGLRGAELGFQIGSAAEEVTNAFGLGGGLALNRPLHRTDRSSLAWIAHGRFSALAGDIESPEDTRYADGTLSILEAGLGLECRNRWGRGDFVTRGLLEYQHWDSNMMTPVSFAGASFGVGYQW